MCSINKQRALFLILLYAILLPACSDSVEKLSDKRVACEKLLVSTNNRLDALEKEHAALETSHAQLLADKGELEANLRLEKKQSAEYGKLISSAADILRYRDKTGD